MGCDDFRPFLRSRSRHATSMECLLASWCHYHYGKFRATICYTVTIQITCLKWSLTPSIHRVYVQIRVLRGGLTVTVIMSWIAIFLTQQRIETHLSRSFSRSVINTWSNLCQHVVQNIDPSICSSEVSSLHIHYNVSKRKYPKVQQLDIG